MTDILEHRKQLRNCREVRNFSGTIDAIEHRGEGKDKEYKFRGLASRTNTWYEVADMLGSFDEMIQSGAFKTTLAENPDVSLLVMHAGLPLASTQSGTMRLWESDRGLEVEADLDIKDNATAREVASGVSRGDITEMSFGFRVVDDEWYADDEDRIKRKVSVLRLHRGDVSVVDRGANPYTGIDREHMPGYDEDEEDYGEKEDGAQRGSLKSLQAQQPKHCLLYTSPSPRDS